MSSADVVRGGGNGLLGTPNDYTWSAGNSAEIDRGWIRCANGPGELAKQISVDPAILDDTITAYNAAARVGRVLRPDGRPVPGLYAAARAGQPG